MSNVIHGIASWPGIAAVIECQYTTSHGVSPGVAILRCLPQTSAPPETGTLTITDSIGTTITLPNCKLDVLRVEEDGDGFIWSLSIRDRRWKWLDFGQISGWYNQMDEHDKLVPWTIQSPGELARLCLEAMGETPTFIDMPDGLTSADGSNWTASGIPPWINAIPKSGLINPPINWPAGTITPAVALDQLCQKLGRVIVYQWMTDGVVIVEPGTGNQLPDGSISRESPSQKKPATPTGVAAAGSPSKFQGRFAMEAVGEEYDRSLRPINDLSYAPRYGGSVQIFEAIAHVINTNATTLFQMFINAGKGQIPTMGVLFEYTYTAGSSADPGAADIVIAINFANQINASDDPKVKGIVTANALNGVVTITGVNAGDAWTFLSRVDTNGSSSSFVFRKTQAATDAAAGWYLSNPGSDQAFADVIATDRLTYDEARALALKHVFRTYRLESRNPNAPGGPFNQRVFVPGYGYVVRRQMVHLLPTKVDQVTPQPLDDKLIDPITNMPVTVDFYNGYSRDKPAICFGQIAYWIEGRAFWVDPTDFFPNTKPMSQIYVPFSVNSNEKLDAQTITFAQPVYMWTEKGSEAPDPLILETGVYVRNDETNAFECYAVSKLLPGMSGVTNFAIRKFEDIQFFVTCTYKADGVTVDKVSVLETDADVRGSVYADAMAQQYQIIGGETRTYNGIVPVDLDGAIMQITWSVGGDGCMTTVSRNTDHHPAILPQPARRRAEFLGPAQIANIVNAIAPQRSIGSNGSRNQPGG